MKRLILLIVLQGFIISWVHSQPTYNLIRRITTQDGLLTNGVKHIYKDSKGIMWFAFSNGIASYDGYTVNRYDDFLPDSCCINSYKFCTCFQEDRQGNIWIGTLKNGFAKLNRATGKFTYFNLDPADPMAPAYNTILSMTIDRQGVIWMGSGNTGIYKFFPENDSLINYNPRSVVDHPGVVAVHSLMEDNSGIIWVGTGQGLFTFDQEREKFTQVITEPPIPERFNKIKPILQDADGDIWFGSDWGVFRYNRKNNQWKHYFTQPPGQPNILEGGYVTGLAEIKTETGRKMWIATPAVLIIYDFSIDRLSYIYGHAKDKDSPAAKGANFIYYDDHNKLLWISSNGITIADPRENTFCYTPIFDFPDTLHDINARSLYEGRDGTIWAGTFGNGLFEFDSYLQFVGHYKPSSWKRNRPDLINKNRISLIFEDSGGRLWVGTSGEGLSVFDRNTKSFETVFFDTKSGVQEMIWVFDIHEDSLGTIWVATQQGLYTYQKMRSSAYLLRPYDHELLSATSINVVFEDSKGRLWMVTGNRGIFCMPPETRDTALIRHYYHQFYSTGLFVNRNVTQIYEDMMGKLWMRSETALFYYNEETDSIEHSEHFRKVLKSENYVLTGDSSGNLWFITEQGLARYDPDDLTERSLKFFSASEGQIYSFIVYTPFIKSRSGHLYMAGSGLNSAGFCRFHPDSVYRINTHLPEVMITDFKIRNEPVELDSAIASKKQLLLKYNQNFFSFEFAAIDYRNPEKNQHAYKLEGYDDDWVYSGSRRFANYTGVPPGGYIFRVKGANNEGYWNEEGARLMLTIAPPPWKTWWAYTVYALFISGLILGWRRYDMKRQNLRQALEVGHIEAEKLKELDRMKSRFFANISHEFRTPLTLILGPIKKLKATIANPDLLEDLNIMQRNASRLQRLIDQLLSLSRIEAGQMKLQASEANIVDFVKGYIGSFESAAIEKNIRMIFHSSQPCIPVCFDRDKMEKILYNLYSNALKFTAAGGLIEVNISGDQSFVFIAISDTGRGILPEHLPHVFDRFYQAANVGPEFQAGSGIGLSLVKELVELHRGAIEVESETDRGTTFTIRLPLGHTHLEAKDLIKVKKTIENSGAEEIMIETRAEQHGLRKPPQEFAESRIKPLLLIVEDNPDMRNYIRGILEGPYLLAESQNGAAALEIILEFVPDLVISDVMMPEMDGYELCSKIKTDERTSHIPVILLTAKAGFEDRLEGLQTGAEEFLVKPFEPMELIIRVRNLIHQRQILREKYRKEFEHVELLPETSMNEMDIRFMEKARKVVGDHISNPDFHISDFSSQMNMSRVQLHRKLSALFNLSATAFVRTCRINEAARLFRNRSGNVTEVAYDVGFNNLSYFSKCFQKQFGMNPSEYLAVTEREDETKYPV
jgi:signal transduction histidine kinase/ligand-binding sensor domain-containing protein/CheY-like chemotaxis protein